MSAAEPVGLAAIAVTHDSAQVLPDWIAALRTAAGEEPIELCVVDSGSSPAQLEATRALALDGADSFVSLPNVGFGAACNAGAAVTGARTLLFANPDTRALSLPQRALRGEGLGGALLGGYATDPDRPLGFAALPGFREEGQELALGRWSRAFARAERDPAWVSGAALAIDRGDFLRIDGFSPAFFMYFEDADLCARHRAGGGAVALDRELLVAHSSGMSTEGERRAFLGPALDSLNRQSGRRFAARYGRPWHGLALYLLLALVYLPRRALVQLGRERKPLGETLDYLACMLFPRRARRRLGAHTRDISPASSRVSPARPRVGERG